MVGDLPVNKPKLWITILAVFAVIMGLGLGLAHSTVTAAAVIGLIVAAITGLILNGNMKSVAHATAANNYVAEGGINITHRKDTFLRKEQSSKKINTSK